MLTLSMEPSILILRQDLHGSRVGRFGDERVKHFQLGNPSMCFEMFSLSLVSYTFILFVNELITSCILPAFPPTFTTGNRKMTILLFAADRILLYSVRKDLNKNFFLSFAGKRL